MSITVDHLALALFNAERTSRGDYPLANLPDSEAGPYKEAASALLPAYEANTAARKSEGPA